MYGRDDPTDMPFGSSVSTGAAGGSALPRFWFCTCLAIRNFAHFSDPEIACTQSGWCAALPCMACYADKDFCLVFVIIVQGCGQLGPQPLTVGLGWCGPDLKMTLV